MALNGTSKAAWSSGRNPPLIPTLVRHRGSIQLTAEFRNSVKPKVDLSLRRIWKEEERWTNARRKPHGADYTIGAALPNWKETREFDSDVLFVSVHAKISTGSQKMKFPQSSATLINYRSSYLKSDYKLKLIQPKKEKGKKWLKKKFVSQSIRCSHPEILFYGDLPVDSSEAPSNAKLLLLLAIRPTPRICSHKFLLCIMSLMWASSLTVLLTVLVVLPLAPGVVFRRRMNHLARPPASRAVYRHN